MRIRTIGSGLAALAVLGPAPGCSMLPATIPRPSMPTVVIPPLPFASRTIAPNPLVVPIADREVVWNEVVVVLDEYFPIASEDRLAGTIVTQPLVGSTIFEPWAGDSVDFEERFESTLQTIRRFAQVSIKPNPGGGIAVKVEVYKQIEDLAKPYGQLGARAVFNSPFPINRTREVVGPVPLPIQWTPRGRDNKLEQVILSRIQHDLAL